MSSGALHNWEAAGNDEHDETWRTDDVDDNDPKLAVDLATQAFLDYLLDHADESKISAKDVCVLCWYAPKAAMSDDVRRIGFRPNTPCCTTRDTWILCLASQSGKGLSLCRWLCRDLV